MAVKVASKLTLLLTDLVEHHSAEGKKSFLPTVWAVSPRDAALFLWLPRPHTLVHRITPLVLRKDGPL